MHICIHYIFILIEVRVLQNESVKNGHLSRYELMSYKQNKEKAMFAREFGSSMKILVVS